MKFKMNFKQLKCFHAVAREGSFTAAARELGVGQPNVTTHIKTLEDYYGVELFCRREGQRVELTDTGRSLLALTRRIFSLEDESDDLLRAASGLKTGHLRIGAASPYQVTEIIIDFGQKYPDVDLSVAISNSQEALKGLLDFHNDVAVLAQAKDDPHLFSRPYCRDKLIAFVGRNHPWSNRSKIKLEQLEGQRVVLREVGSITRKAFEDALAQADVTIRRVLEIGSHEAVREAVAHGIGIGVVLESEFVPDRRLRPLKISNADIYVQIDVVCLQERHNAPMIKAFFEVVKDMTEGP